MVSGVANWKQRLSPPNGSSQHHHSCSTFDLLIKEAYKVRPVEGQEVDFLSLIPVIQCSESPHDTTEQTFQTTVSLGQFTLSNLCVYGIPFKSPITGKQF